MELPTMDGHLYRIDALLYKACVVGTGCPPFYLTNKLQGRKWKKILKVVSQG